MGIRHVGAYIKLIDVQDGLVNLMREGSTKHLNSSKDSKWAYRINANTLQPKDSISLMAAGNVRVRMYSKDPETNEFYNIGETIVTDRLTHIRVRQFIVSDVIHINKSVTKEGIVFADLEF